MAKFAQTSLNKNNHYYKVNKESSMLSQCGQNANIHVTVLYENIDQILPNKLHGPMHYKIGDTGVYNEHVFYTLCIQWTRALYSVFTMDTCSILCVYNGHLFYTLL